MFRIAGPAPRTSATIGLVVLVAGLGVATGVWARLPQKATPTPRGAHDAQERAPAPRADPAVLLSERPTATPGVSAHDPAAFPGLIEGLRLAVRQNDADAISRFVNLLSVPGRESEERLWVIIASGDKQLARVLGSVLGRIGGPETIERCVRALTELGRVKQLQIGLDGTAPPERALLDSLVMNALHEFLARPETRAQATDAFLALAATPDLHATARQVILLRLLSDLESEVLSRIDRMFAAEQVPETRVAIVLAMVRSRSTHAAVLLTDWYESHPELRRELSLALAANLPARAAVDVLRSHVAGDLGSGRAHSPALSGIAWVGRTADGAATLRDLLPDEATPEIRKAMLEGVAMSGQPWASEVVATRARSDPSDRVRAAAYAFAPASMDGPLAFELLAAGFDSESAADARQGAVAGLVNLLGRGTRAPEVLSMVERELVASAAPELQRLNLVRSVLTAARSSGTEAAAREMLSRVLGGLGDGALSAAIRQELNPR